MKNAFVAEESCMTPKKTCAPRARKTKPKAPRALLIHGGWEGHEPDACARRFGAWLETRGFDTTLSPTLDALLDKKLMRGLDLVIPLWTMGAITREQREALCDAVRNGSGLAGWHGGMCDAFRNDTEYQFMTGGQWVAHPGGVIRYTVDGLDPDDPVTRGLKPFRMHSEQYYMHTDPGNRVLAWTTFNGRHAGVTWIKGTRMPVAWKRMWGKGRVFYTSLGHVNKDFDVPEAFEIAKRGIQWAARLAVKPEYSSH